eukprot:5194495-Pleurochrysis_carterae.AAC.5
MRSRLSGYPCSHACPKSGTRARMLAPAPALAPPLSSRLASAFIFLRSHPARRPNLSSTHRRSSYGVALSTGRRRFPPPVRIRPPPSVSPP